MSKNVRTSWSHPKDPMGNSIFYGCLRKTSYESERIAKKSGDSYGYAYRIYKCKECKKYHLTTKV